MSADPTCLRIGPRTDLYAQLTHRYDTVVIDEPLSEHSGREVLHFAVQHLLPGGSIRCAWSPLVAVLAEDFALHLDAPDGDGVVRLRRTERTTIHDLVFEARQVISRVTASELCARLAGRRPPHVLDTRTPTDRARAGVIPGSRHVPRTVLEWHLDPANGYRLGAVGLDDPLVVVCNGGYSSSLAAASLVRLGFTDVADLVGGVRAWQAAGLPLDRPDHTHLDL